MREAKHHVYFDDFEHRLLVGCLMTSRNEYLREGKPIEDVNDLAEKEGITERLKSDDQMEWVRQMNTVRQTATEIVNHDLIYE